jgi:hypothetical protein
VAEVVKDGSLGEMEATVGVLILDIGTVLIFLFWVRVIFVCVLDVPALHIMA